MRAALIVLVLGLAAATSVEGQGGCGKCHDHGFFGESVHHFDSGDSHACAPNSCHPGDQWGTCANWHYQCGGGETFRFFKEHGWDHVEQVLATADASTIKALTLRIPKLAYVPARGAFQVEDCDGHVIAHFAILEEEAFARASNARRGE